MGVMEVLVFKIIDQKKNTNQIETLGVVVMLISS